MTPSEHNQAEYVRGIQAGKRIERQNHTAISVATLMVVFCIGMAVGAAIIVMGLPG